MIAVYLKHYADVGMLDAGTTADMFNADLKSLVGSMGGRTLEQIRTWLRNHRDGEITTAMRVRSRKARQAEDAVQQTRSAMLELIKLTFEQFEGPVGTVDHVRQIMGIASGVLDGHGDAQQNPYVNLLCVIRV